MSVFPPCERWTRHWEGGYGVPDQPTNAGITQSDYDAMRYAKGLPNQSVRLISEAEITEFYQGRWTADLASIDSQALSIKLFDAQFLYGSGEGVKCVQRAVRPLVAGPIVVDGALGSATLGAVNIADAYVLMERFVAKLNALVVEIVLANPAKRVFVDGWTERNCAIPRAGINF